MMNTWRWCGCMRTAANQTGAVLVVALMMLVILSIMGGYALTISSIEQRVTRNSEVFQHNFYAAEAVTLEAATTIFEEDDADLDVPSYGWLKIDDPAIDLTQSSQWPSALIAPADTSLTEALSAFADITPPGYAPDSTSAGDRIWYAAIDNGTCGAWTGSGGSLTGGPGAPQERCYDVYGMYDIKRGGGKTYTGRMMMTIGYKKVLYN
ncbi:MAG: pilus assembly PilX N-terminal domain-containing protein [Desulfobulbaceae bacterium]|nr:pilus assembly PilX N-terminal domain-containing protein [Desulfobulbaceae bacterium]